MLNDQHMPPPVLVVMHNNACEAIKLSANALGRLSNAQMYAVDVPVNAEEQPEEALAYVTAQLQELVRFVEERFPGHKFNEALFEELLEADRVATECCQAIYEARKAVPCPVDGRDAFRELRLPSWYSNWRPAVQYFREWRDEMVERAEKGLSNLEEEKLRFLWAVSGPFYFDPFPLLAKRGVAVPYFQYGMAGRMWGTLYPNYGEEQMFGRTLTPMEEMARFVMYNSWAGLGNRWLDDTLRVARDLKVNGIINFIQVGCTAISGLNTVLAQNSERELGIPTLNIEGRMLDATFFDQSEFETRMDVFIDSCLDRKAAV
jgi:benzoyl-CoA reductase/2-hydroxyglutaryl-CoA dehydratase subunit BcrC/BadD/HgdB